MKTIFVLWVLLSTVEGSFPSSYFNFQCKDIFDLSPPKVDKFTKLIYHIVHESDNIRLFVSP